ncbi:MAG: putative Ig domain-containing protein [Spirochaetes bacterium]|nr:putative Ig domain-containing protein [Spirochaetota bacterium]
MIKKSLFPILILLAALLPGCTGSGGNSLQALLLGFASRGGGENETAPSGFAYTTPVTYTQWVEITPNVPTVTGTVTSWSVDPDLPVGLTIDGDGTISGTPTALQAETSYTVTAGNDGGSTTATILITVNDAPPSGLAYTTPVIYTQGVEITPNEPSVTGTVTSWSVDPDLPEGLALDPATGTISGTPAAVQAAADYTVTAGNSGGSDTAVIRITINHAPPTGLAYTTPVNYTRGVEIPDNVPAVTGTVTSWSVDPDLPEGLILETDGRISGTPTTLQSSTQYTVTASNSGGFDTADIWIEITEELPPPPSGLSYTTPVVYTIAQAITPNEPTVTGTVTSWSVDPALPEGLTLDPVTGTISGTPAEVLPSAPYTVTAANSGGYTTAVVQIAIDCGGAAGAVSGLTATDGAYGNQVSLDWEAADNAIFYRVYRAQEFLTTSTPAVQVGGNIYGTEFNDTTVGPGLHSYYVVAYSYCGAGGTSDTDTGYRTITDYEFFDEGYAELEPLMVWLQTANLMVYPQTVPGTVSGQFVYDVDVNWLTFAATATLTFTDYSNYYLTGNGVVNIEIDNILDMGNAIATGTVYVTGIYNGYVRFDDIEVDVGTGTFIGGNYAVSQDGGVTETIIPGDYIPGE